MKINVSTRIIGNKVILVPYRRHHVEQYHKWMALPEIQQLTSSEPLSLDDEYKMQESWRNDEDKLTFIILRRDLYDDARRGEAGTDNERNEIEAMVGDVNVFISSTAAGDDGSKGTAELEVMVVDEANRGKGYGIEAVFLIMTYCLTHVLKPSIAKFVVKIGEEDVPSIRVFEKLGFKFQELVKVFKQITLKLDINEETISQLNALFKDTKFIIENDY